MDYARKNGVTEPLGAYMPGSYESERVTYGNTNVKDELDAINSKLPSLEQITYTTNTTNCVVDSGSIYRFGDLVIVQIKLHTTRALVENLLVSGLPAVKGFGTSETVKSFASDKVQLKSDGKILTYSPDGSTLSAFDTTISVCYVAE